MLRQTENEVISLEELHQKTRDLALMLEDKKNIINNLPCMDKRYIGWYQIKGIDLAFTEKDGRFITHVVINVAANTCRYISAEKAVEFINTALKSPLPHMKYPRLLHKNELCINHLIPCKKLVESILQKNYDKEKALERVYGKKM